MPSRLAIVDSTSPTGLGWAQRVVRRQLDALARLAAAALGLVDAAPLQAVSNIGDFEKALSLRGRVQWALRLIDALRAKLLGDLHALRNGETPSAAASAVADPETRIEAEPRREAAERAERERPGRFERLVRRDDFTQLLKRPTDEIIALICRELGLPADWPRLAEEAFEHEEAEDAFSSPARGGGGPAQQVEGALRPLPAPS